MTDIQAGLLVPLIVLPGSMGTVRKYLMTMTCPNVIFEQFLTAGRKF